MNIFSDEDYYGKVEYKRYFNTKNKIRIQNYITQLNFRMNEGNGSCIYLVGVNDDGSVHGLDDDLYDENIDFIKKMCKILKFNIKIMLHCKYIDKRFFMVKIIGKPKNFL